MSTTDQGNAYENKVFRLVKKLIADGTVAVGKHYSLHQKKAYPIDFGTYQELVELSRSDNPEIREQADAWLVSIDLQDAAELKVSAFLLDLAIRNVRGEITREEVSQRLKEHYGDMTYEEPKSSLDDGYEVISADSPKIKEIEEYNRKLRPALYAKLDKNGSSRNSGAYVKTIS